MTILSDLIDATELVKLLLKNGADPNYNDGYGESFLASSIRKCKYISGLLIEYGAKILPNEKDQIVNWLNSEIDSYSRNMDRYDSYSRNMDRYDTYHQDMDRYDTYPNKIVLTKEQFIYLFREKIDLNKQLLHQIGNSKK